MALMAAVRGKQARIAIGILYGVVENHDPVKTHCLQRLVRERLSDKTSDLSREFLQFAALGFDTDLLGDAIAVCKQRTLEYRNLVGHARGRLEILGQQDILGPLGEPEALLLQTFNPLGTGVPLEVTSK